MYLTEKDVGRRFETREGKIVTGVEWDQNGGEFGNIVRVKVWEERN